MTTSGWLDCSLSSAESSFLVSGLLCPSASLGSLDINVISGFERYVSLLSNSPSLGSLCTVSSISPSDIPAFPFVKKEQPPLLLVPWESSLVLPKAGKHRRPCQNVLITSPTPPRLMRMPYVKRRISNWTTLTCGVEPPDVVPWSSTLEAPSPLWIPEGSCFPPEYLRERLAENHGFCYDSLPPSFDNDEICELWVNDDFHPQRRLRRRASHNPTYSHREALVLDTEIHVNTNGRVRRWSMSAPASYMNAELIERRLEMQRLEAYMRDDVHRIDVTLAQLGEEMDHLAAGNVPEIKVSTSTTTVPVSVASAAMFTRAAAPQASVAPLAVRRGQKVPAPLSLKQAKQAEAPEVLSYPGIPTAFLGTPKEYSQEVSLATAGTSDGGSAMDVGDMIGNLKSQLDSIKPRTPMDLRVEENISPWSPASSAGALSQDDWAFAQDLLAQYGDPMPAALSAKMPAKNAAKAPAKTPTKTPVKIPVHAKIPTKTPAKTPAKTPNKPQRAARISEPPSTKIGGTAANASNKQRLSTPVTVSRHATKAAPATRMSALKSRNGTPARLPQGGLSQKKPLGSAARSSLAPTTPRDVTGPKGRPRSSMTPALSVPRWSSIIASPVTPITPSPIPGASAAPGGAPRGILKHAKSVRFASSSTGDVPPSSLSKPPATPPRSALKQASPPKQPSPLWMSFSGEEASPVIAPTMALSARVARKSIAVENPGRRDRAVIAPDRRKSCHLPAPSSLEMAASVLTPANGSTQVTLMPPLGPEDPRAVSPVSPTPPGKGPTKSRSLRLRKSLPLLSGNKENRSVVSRFSLATPKQRASKDENSARRASTSEADSGSRKTRRGTPLKAIFQRLKA
ncbi:hypothetical protein EVG20_g1465 [Dentipellis fragilis]|uniref:Uncharacterized protein n=1 Tax=Dentipellis fragilis TaxID=205917 RepID=A0A4Y9ZCJ1_9AGAM|nr:hypothetical protein EVG20_g1465 [Dentipellis fragilis]